jgi:hypothetical protein
MMVRGLVACLLILSIAPLAPLAFASPIDPSCPGGWYDGGDFDDVIDIINSSVGTVELVPPALLRPLRIVLGAIAETAPPSPSSTSRSPFSGRAPPIA